jgi:PAS domain S-box-containing protein
MRSFRDLSIRTKLTILLLGTISLVLLVSITFIINDIHLIKSSKVDHVKALADLLAGNVAAALDFDDRKAAGDVLLSLRFEPSVVFARVYNAKGEVFATYSAGTAQQLAPPWRRTEEVSFTDDGYLEIVKAIRRENETTGTIFLRVSMAEIQAHVTRYLVTAAILLVSSLGIATWLAFRLQRLISDPILRLAEATQAVASRADFSIRVEKESNDELGILCDQFNAMLTNIQERGAALYQSEEQFRTFFEQAAVGMAQVAANSGRYLRVNAKLCEITGYSADELRELAHGQIAHPDDREADRAHFQQLVRGEFAGPIPETRYVRKDGQIICVQVTAALIRDASGQVLRAIEVIQDVSDRKRAEEELRRFNVELEERVHQRTAQLEAANKELEAFSYSVSHDLRAPLRAVDGFSQKVLRDFAAQLPAEALHQLGRVRVNAQKMGQLIDDLLTFSRLSRQPLRKQAVAPADLVRQALEDLRWEREDRRVEIHVGELAPCQGDPALLKQVFVNLLSNALKYSRKRDPAIIEIGCRQGELPGETVYYIKDNGAGFDMRYAGKLFGVFQRLHRAEDYEGTGVGLAIVQRIIHRHGGRIWAEAEVEKGATFSFTLEGEGPG